MKSNVKKFLSILFLSASALGMMSSGTVGAVLNEEERRKVVCKFSKMGMGDYYRRIKEMKEKGKLTTKEAFVITVFGCLKGKSELRKGNINLTYGFMYSILREELFDVFLSNARNFIKEYLDASRDEAEAAYTKVEEQTLRVLNEVMEGRKDLEEAFRELDPHVIYGNFVDIPQELEKVIGEKYSFDRSKSRFFFPRYRIYNFKYKYWHKIVLELVRDGKLSRENAFKLMAGEVFGFWSYGNYSAEQMEEAIRFILVQGEDYTEFFKLFDKRKEEYAKYYTDGESSDSIEYRTLKIVDSLEKGTMDFNTAYDLMAKMFDRYKD